MNDKLIGGMSGARSGIVTAVAVAGGYWASQILAAYFVSAGETGLASKMAGALCLGLFAALFAMHLLRPWSKAAAILGLCSLAVMAGAMWYYASPTIIRHFPSATWALVISTILGISGIALDIERCWRICRLDLSQSLWLKLGHNVRAVCHHEFHPIHH